jgi:methyltransferase (TIGR00027 family)
MERRPAEVGLAPGHTATLAAVGRAMHAASDKSRLLEDHLALKLAGDAGTTLLAELTKQLPGESRETFGLLFVMRARFVEDAVDVAIQDGVAQYVILGAGLDSFAYRRADLEQRLKIFEVDRAGAQVWKRRRLEELGVAIPSSLSFVPLDHETDDLRAALVEAGFDLSAPAIVSAMALTQYLALPAVERILSLVGTFPAGSRLVITYVVPATELTELESAGLNWTMSQAEARGEPFLSMFRPDEIDQLIRRNGFTRVDHLGPHELRALYLSDRPEVQIPGIERLAIAFVGPAPVPV